MNREIWARALDEYLTAMKAARRAPGTIRLHRHYLTQLRGQHRDPWRVTTRQLRALLANPRWGPETARSARSVWRGFYRWAHGMGYVDVDPALPLEAITVPVAVARPAPEHVVREVTRQNRDRRLQRMATLAAHYAMRAGEIARVHGDDLLGDELLVHGKGGKERVVPIIDPALLMWLRQVDGWAFPNGRGSHLSAGHVTRLLSEALAGHWTAHTLRHRCATVSYAATRDLLAVGALLGHSRPETTQRYVQLPRDAVRAAVQAASA